MSGLRNVEARRFMIIRHFFPTEREIVFGTHFVIPCPSVTQVEYYSPSDGNQGGSVVRAFRVGHNRKRNTSPPLVYSKKNRKRNASNHSPFPTKREIAFVLMSCLDHLDLRESLLFLYMRIPPRNRNHMQQNFCI